MSLVFAGACSHAPGITGRAARAEPAQVKALYRSFERLREALEASRPDALIVVAAEHFANFFMNNMPAYCIGMAPSYQGPIEDENWARYQAHRGAGRPGVIAAHHQTGAAAS